MKEAYYFSHDSNARHDPKITAMRGVYGSEGYGWYWMLVEMMRESDGYKLDLHSKYTFNAFALQMQSDSKTIAQFVHDCIHEFNLFESDEEYFWSRSLMKRMEKKEQKSEKARQSAQKRWEKEREYADDMRTHNYDDANVSKSDASKGKESKVKEIKNKDIYTLVPDNTEQENIPFSSSPIPYKEIVDYLNEKTGSKYKSTSDKTQSLIKARLNNGFSLDDFKHVIDIKTTEWLHDEDMKKYLRPETLFGNKFEGYLNQKLPTTKKTSSYEVDTDLIERAAIARYL